MCTNDLAYVGASSANIEPRQEPSGGNPARESADLLAPDCRSRRAGSCSECESCDATCRPAVVWFTPGDDARRPAARLSRLPASSARRLAARIVGALKLAHHGSRTHPHRGRSRLTHCDHTGDGRADGSLPADLAQLIATMYDTMDAANGVGLAANQIGCSLRLFVYDCAADRAMTARRRGVVINPVLETSEIPETMPDPDTDDEGCLSVPGESFPTGRAKWARVTGLDADGSPVSIEGTGLFARMLQHETGHLDGFLYLDRLIGRYARNAKRAVKSHGWGVPGLSWLPGEDPDPFGH